MPEAPGLADCVIQLSDYLQVSSLHRSNNELGHPVAPMNGIWLGAKVD